MKIHNITVLILKKEISFNHHDPKLLNGSVLFYYYYYLKNK